MTPFEGFDLSDFWEEPGDCARKNYIEPPPTAEVIRQVEKELGYKLPESYIALMQVQNGGFSKIEDIMKIEGIKEGMFAKMKDKICVRGEK